MEIFLKALKTQSAYIEGVDVGQEEPSYHHRTVKEPLTTRLHRIQYSGVRRRMLSSQTEVSYSGEILHRVRVN